MVQLYQTYKNHFEKVRVGLIFDSAVDNTILKYHPVARSSIRPPKKRFD